MSCDFSRRVAGKGVRGAVARSEAENLWKGRGGLICERNMGMIAGNWITVKIQYLGTYHSNETRGS